MYVNSAPALYAIDYLPAYLKRAELIHDSRSSDPRDMDDPMYVLALCSLTSNSSILQ